MKVTLLYNQLIQYIEHWNSLNYHLKKEVKYSIDCDAFIAFIQTFEQSYKQYLREGNAINIWDVCCIGYDELKHSHVLSWLFDHKGSHGIGNEFLNCFIDYLNAKKLNQEANIKMHHISNFYDVLTETTYSDNTYLTVKSRVDIEIENKDFLIIIEVKVQAGETGDQLVRYNEIGKIKSKLDNFKPWELVFLTKRGCYPVQRQTSNYDEMSNKIICLSWLEVANLLKKFSVSLNSNLFLKNTLNQYSNYIKKTFK